MHICATNQDVEYSVESTVESRCSNEPRRAKNRRINILVTMSGILARPRVSFFD